MTSAKSANPTLKKKGPGIAAGAEAVGFRRRKNQQKEPSTTILGHPFQVQVPV
jgi:hypothetical protein